MDAAAAVVVAFAAVQLNLWCAVCVINPVSLTLSSLANTRRKTPFHKDKDVVFHPLLLHPTGKT